MPTGFRVILGDGILDSGDLISGPPSGVDFVTDTVLGAGSWIWTGTDGGFTANNTTEPGDYFLGTDGFVYFVPDFGTVTTLDASAVAAAPAYDAAIYGTSGNDALINGTDNDDLIYGGADRTGTGTGADTIDAGSGDDEVFGGDGDDSILGGDGEDTLSGQNGADTIDGGYGDDSIDGGAGDDVLGGSQAIVTSTSESLNWSTQGAAGTDISSGFTQDTGTMGVTFTYVDDGAGTDAEVSDATNYVDTGEPFAATSSIALQGNGSGPTSTSILEFAAEAGSGMSDEVENVSFRLGDVDTGGWQDEITILAYDADGNAVTATLTAAGADTVVGNTVTAAPGNDTAASAEGSVLVSIAGPVSRVEIVYSNLANGGQVVLVTDVHFDTIPASDSDTILGGTGDDTITVGPLDEAYGEDGDDTFLIDASLLDGGAITVVGGEGNETNGDTLDLTGILDKGSIVYSNEDDDAGGLSGTATLTDGTIVTFSEIETIICFTEGTAIQTPRGERRIETLKAGDLVLTLDNGPQPIRWIGRRSVRATGKLAPIRFAKGSIGNHRDLLVSPQHRMLYGSYRTQLRFGQPEVLAPAHSLVDDFDVTIDYGGMVTYIHMLFDQHELVIANGAPSESFFPGDQGLSTLADPARDELFSIFPELRTNIGSYGPASRVCLKAQEARALVTM